jgi:Uma2 family endonuclease
MPSATTTQTPAIEPMQAPPAPGGSPPAPEVTPSVRSIPAPVDGLYRLSLEEYHRLAEASILSDERVELIEGLLVKKMTKNTPHMIATANVNAVLHSVKPDGWFVMIGDPITLPESGSEPEPDAKLVRGRPHDYRGKRIGPADVALVIEVSDSSLHEDHVVKKSVYAASSVPIYWIVNIPDARIEVYTDPTGPDSSPDYRRREDYAAGTEVPLVLDGKEVARIAVADLLP